MRVKTESDHTRPHALRAKKSRDTGVSRLYKNDCFAVYSTDGKCLKTMGSFTRTRIQGRNNRVLAHPIVKN